MSATASAAEPTASVTSTAQPLLRFSAVAGLALLCGLISQRGAPGSIIALPCGLLMLLILRQGAQRGVALTAATSWLAVLIWPGPLSLTLHWLCLSAVMLSATGIRLAHTADATVIPAALLGLFASPFRAIRHSLTRQAPYASGATPVANRFAFLFLPVLATLTFSFLLASANPVFENMLAVLAWQRLVDGLDALVIFASCLALLLILAIRHIRPVGRGAVAAGANAGWHAVLFNRPAVTLTLALLNGLFLIENVLDLHIIWLSGELPHGFTHAQYVHRGSYTLIGTAILAALLATTAMRPGSPTERSPLLRRLVYTWMLQNMFLVASSASRTISYIEDYGMSMWRLSGLIWMGIVAIGLGLVMVRLRRGRSSLWLTNANLAVCLAVLMACSFIDLRWIVAEWNASAAIARSPVALDEEYLASLGPSALPAFLRLQRAGVIAATPCTAPGQLATPTPLPAIAIPLREQQAHWQTYSLRDAHYLRQLETAIQACGERR